MKAVQFGGGNIGRGFVAEFLHTAGYEVVFVDVVDSVISQLQSTPSYRVVEVGVRGESTRHVSNYRAINSKTNPEAVVAELADADLVTCAVGPNILKFIAPLIARGIDARAASTPLAVIACENAIGASDMLLDHVKEHTSSSRIASLSDRARFANSAIDRIVPMQLPDQGLDVRIEKFSEWVVDQKPFAPFPHPPIDAIHWVDDLLPFIERKLYTVNTGHATAAYFGYVSDKHMVHDALEDPFIRARVHAALEETSRLIVAKFGVDPATQRAYADRIVNRISSRALRDVITRVCRAPLRKVSLRERFIGPASQLAERGDRPDALMLAFEQALRFQRVEGDDESFKLAEILHDFGPYDATAKLTGLSRDHPLFAQAAEHVSNVQNDTISGYQLRRPEQSFLQPIASAH